MLTKNLGALAGKHANLLLEFHQGIEKEGLRVLGDLSASLSPHAQGLGHKLTHPHITTDYAENLLEFVTPVFKNNQELLDFLNDLQTFTLRNMSPEELIWASSMPCLLPDEKQIPIANFGASNVGRLKSLYREGLGNRYGRSMQSIAGMHFNYSLSRDLIKTLNEELCPEMPLKEFTDHIYFKLIRNFRRHSWLLSYLFGASPVVDENFLKGKKHQLSRLGKETFGKEYGTSLRMGGLGYTSAAQDEIAVCYNRLDTYVSTLESARKRSYPAYEKIGVKVDGVYRQLNANLLQIDNEFYSTLRPKRTAKSGESALQALYQSGVEYIEVRLLDLNPFAPTGISDEGIKFLQLFLTFCLLEESPVIGAEECEIINQNFDLVVNEGRNPKTLLTLLGRDSSNHDSNKKKESITVREYAQLLLEKMDLLLDSSKELKAYYREGLEAQLAKTRNTNKLLSEMVLNSVSDSTSFAQATYELASKHKDYLLGREFGQAKKEEMEKVAKESFGAEEAIRKSDQVDFDSFLKNYFESINIEEYK